MSSVGGLLEFVLDAHLLLRVVNQLLVLMVELAQLELLNDLPLRPNRVHRTVSLLLEEPLHHERPLVLQLCYLAGCLHHVVLTVVLSEHVDFDSFDVLLDFRFVVVVASELHDFFDYLFDLLLVCRFAVFASR